MMTKHNRIFRVHLKLNEIHLLPTLFMILCGSDYATVMHITPDKFDLSKLIIYKYFDVQC